ncbi:IclR family transcriptional regulator [Achromobacter sp. F4_2707]|uniref:IclR family transcriptional regulator n=1 Tax=Achromobacter sp. F4_2707 TaxID=3114286 RepID=UPI0039C6109E
MVSENKNQLVSALARGISILRCFTPMSRELSGRELIEMTGLPKPTLFRLLETLCELGLLRYSERISKYQPGIALLNMGAPVLARMTIRQLARPMMQDLANHIVGQIQLSVGEGPNLLYAELVQGRQSQVFRPEIGMRISLSRTASGRAYLSSWPEAEREEYLERLRKRDSERATWLESRLAETVHDLQEYGFCRSHGDLHREIVSIAVPMRKPIDGESWVFAASVPVFSEQGRSFETDLGPRLITVVRSVEAALGNISY